jgi:ribosomal protein S6E (S10)
MRPLTGPRLKLTRAANQLNALNDTIQGFHESKPYRIVVNTDEKPGWYVARVQVLNDVDPMWGVIAGEVAHDLRSALDGLVWQLARLDSGLESTKSQLLVSLRRRSFRNAAKKGFLEELSTRHIAMLERFQPYKGGDKHSSLWLLHQLNIADKHHAIQVIGATAQEFGFSIPGGQDLSGFRMLTGVMGKNRPLIDGAKLGEAQILQPLSGNKVDVYPQLSVQIQFSEGCAAVEELPALSTLSRMAYAVQDVLDSFEAEFPP